MKEEPEYTCPSFISTLLSSVHNYSVLDLLTQPATSTTRGCLRCAKVLLAEVEHTRREEEAEDPAKHDRERRRDLE